MSSSGSGSDALATGVRRESTGAAGRREEPWECSLALHPPWLAVPFWAGAVSLLGVAMGCLEWVQISALPPDRAEQLTRVGLIALGAAALTIAVGLWMRPRTGGCVHAGPEGLEMPLLAGARRRKRVDWKDVTACHPFRIYGRDRLLLSARGRINMSWSARSFVEPDSLERLAAAVTAGVGALPDGAGRLEALARRARAAEIARRGRPWLTYGLVGVLVGIYAAESALGAPDDDLRLLMLGANSSILVAQGEIHRLVTANLLHGFPLHLAANASVLAFLGWTLERLVGRARYALVLMAGALVGNAAFVLSMPAGLAVGASAMVSAGLGLFIWLAIAYRDQIPANLILPWWFWLSLPAIALLELDVPLIAHSIHMAALAAGLAAAALSCRGVPLVDLRGHGRVVLTRVALGVGAILAVGLAVGVWRTAQDLHATGPRLEQLESVVQKALQ